MFTLRHLFPPVDRLTDEVFVKMKPLKQTGHRRHAGMKVDIANWHAGLAIEEKTDQARETYWVTSPPRSR